MRLDVKERVPSHIVFDYHDDWFGSCRTAPSFSDRLDPDFGAAIGQ